MSALFQGVPNRAANGALKIGDGVAAPDHYANGIGYEASGDMSVDIGGVVDHHHQGLPYTAAGRICVAITGPIDHFGSGAAPFDANGRLIVAAAAPTHFSSGVAYTADGFLASG